MAEIVLAVDPGDVRIGLAVSDPSGTIARPYIVISHVSRREDAETILAHAGELKAGEIVVGLALNEEGEIGPQARKGLRLANELRELTDLPVKMWDESGSTVMARQSAKSQNPVDALAAAYILQDYLNAKK